MYYLNNIRFKFLIYLFYLFTQVKGESIELKNITIFAEDYPPYSYINSRGQVDGINTKKVKAALKKLNLDIPIKVIPWARAYEMTTLNKNVFLYTCSRTSEREHDFKWVALISISDVSVYALKSKHIKISDIEDMKKYKIGAVYKYRYLPYLYNRGFPSDSGGNIQTTISDVINLRKLLFYRIDLMVIDSQQMMFIENKLNIDSSQIEKVFEIVPLRTKDYIVTGKKTSDRVVEEFRKGFE